MVVPDFELICEIMLVAEGFLEARLLARKFITLYSLCKELLSKQVEVSSVFFSEYFVSTFQSFPCVPVFLLPVSVLHHCFPMLQ